MFSFSDSEGENKWKTKVGVMDQLRTGGCACGTIRFECSGAPMHMSNCHCRDCQRATGGPYFPSATFNTETFTILQGAPKWYETRSDGGDVVGRAFCEECGSPMFFLNIAKPDLYAICASAFDDPAFYKPTHEIYTSSAQHWTVRDETIPQYERSSKGA